MHAQDAREIASRAWKTYAQKANTAVHNAALLGLYDVRFTMPVTHHHTVRAELARAGFVVEREEWCGGEWSATINWRDKS